MKASTPHPYPQTVSTPQLTTSRIIEDGSRTGNGFLILPVPAPPPPFLLSPNTPLPHPDNRIGVAEFTVPPKTSGPPPHWHEMHDEVFFTTRGTLRFHALDGQTVDAAVGDTMTVPTRSPHTFSNPFDEEARFLNTFTPAHYVSLSTFLFSCGGRGVAQG